MHWAYMCVLVAVSNCMCDILQHVWVVHLRLVRGLCLLTFCFVCSVIDPSISPFLFLLRVLPAAAFGRVINYNLDCLVGGPCFPGSSDHLIV
jgi:hypothetical protein